MKVSDILKKYVLPNLPYLMFLWVSAKLGETVRLAPGADASMKMLGLSEGFSLAFGHFLPTAGIDLLIGLCGMAAVRLAVYIKGKDAKKYRKNVEYGSARWGTKTDIAPFMDPKPENNIILTQSEGLMMSGRPKNPANARNKNVLVVGGSGSGKTRFFIKPNLMQMHSSYVVTDPKGTVLVECGKLLQRGAPKLDKDGKPVRDKRGKIVYEPYKIRVFNTINFSKSMHFNPFAYIHDEKDILKIVTTLIANTKGEGKAGDDFWVKAETLLYTALIGYIYYEAPTNEQNFATLVEMLNAMEVREDDESFKNAVDLLFDALEQKDPDHFALRQYKKYKLAAGVVCSKRLLNQAVGKSLRTHNLKPKKGAQVMRKNEKITALYERLHGCRRGGRHGGFDAADPLYRAGDLQLRIDRPDPKNEKEREMKRLILTVLAAGAVGAAAAQECGEPMTLQRCLELGLEQNYDVRIIRNEQRISDNDATAANAGMLPSVDLTAGYSGALDNERTTPREGDAVIENGIYDQTFDAGVAVNWTLFDGFRIRTNYKRLQELQQMGALRTRITIEDFVATLTAEYYNYVQQTLRLSNFRYAVQLSRERLRITEERFKIGSFSRLDLLQARVDFNADSSKYMSQHELVTASRIRINELLANDDLNGRLSICDSLIEVNSTLEWDRLEAETRAANASLLLAGHDNTLAELDLKSIRSRFYPYLNLTAGYGYTYNRFGNGATQSRGTLGLNAGVKLGFTIFDGNRRREQRNARITIENTELTRQQLEQSLMANLSNFWQAYRNNLEVIQLETENLIAARENYEIAMERYLLGDLPGIEMREAQKSLLDAEERILTAQYNTKLCEISLQQISGNIGVYLQ